jgi:hypothetical protein
MSKDLEAWLGGGYFFGGMAFIAWFLLTETPASRLLLSLAARPFGRVMVIPLVMVYWILWPIALVGLGLWNLLLKERGRADA